MKDWKSILLATSSFIDNEYLDLYIKLIASSHEVVSYMEKHHVIPVAYYKYKYDIDTRKHRREANKYANADPDNACVLLSFADHCKAHWLLIKCTTTELSAASSAAFFRQIAGLRCIDNKFFKKQHSRIYDIGLTKEEYTWLQHQAEEAKLNAAHYITWTPEQDEWLRQNRYLYTAKQCADILDKTEKAILCRSTALGLKKIWYTDEENAEFISYSETHTADECAIQFKTSKHNVIKRWRDLGFSKTFKWTTEMDIWLRENDDKYTVAEIAEHFGTTKTVIMGRRWKLGITKWERTK